MHTNRPNNFNLVRLTAALAVLVAHAYVFTDQHPYGTTSTSLAFIQLGASAVDAFFVISGFLVTGSLMCRCSLPQFLAARALRIYPGLVVSILLTAFVLGPAFSSLPLAHYLTNAQTWTFVWHNTTLLFGVRYRLPGVTFPATVNGSLWTLPFELAMYLILGAMWLTVECLAMPLTRLRRFKVVVLGATVVATALHFSRLLAFEVPSQLAPVVATAFSRLMFMFFCGAAFRVLDERIPLSAGRFWFAVAALGVSALEGGDQFFIISSLTLAYITLWFARIPGGRVREFNRLGDYSYGVYICAFPIGQAVVSVIPSVSFAGLLVISTPMVLVLAALSWHFIERPALQLKAKSPNILPRRDELGHSADLLAAGGSNQSPSGKQVAKIDCGIPVHPGLAKEEVAD